MFGSFYHPSAFGFPAADDMFVRRPQHAQRRSATADPLAGLFGMAPRDAEHAAAVRQQRQREAQQRRAAQQQAEAADLAAYRRQQQQRLQAQRRAAEEARREAAEEAELREALRRVHPAYRRALVEQWQQQKQREAQRRAERERAEAEAAELAAYEQAAAAEAARVARLRQQEALRRKMARQQQQEDECHVDPVGALFGGAGVRDASVSPARGGSEASSASDVCAAEERTPSPEREEAEVDADADAGAVMSAAVADDAASEASADSASEVAEADAWEPAAEAEAADDAASSATTAPPAAEDARAESADVDMAEAETTSGAPVSSEQSGVDETAVDHALVQINDICSNGLASAEIWEKQAYVVRTAENAAEVRKARLHYTERLLQCVLKLDGVMTLGNTRIRAARKEAIVQLEGMVSALQAFAKENDAVQ